jgi:hypothetical protein
MEAKVLLPCSEQLSIDFCLEPIESSPHPQPCFPKIQFNITLHLHMCLQSSYSLEAFGLKFCTHFSTLPYVQHGEFLCLVKSCTVTGLHTNAFLQMLKVSKISEFFKSPCS